MAVTLQSPNETRFMPTADFDDFFNWTMTYRADSDIPTPYGRVVPKASGFSYVPNSGWEHKYDPVKVSHLQD